jgi:hypothetical protein
MELTALKTTHNHSIHVQWEPGNGTRYDVMITHLEQPFMGHGNGVHLITVSDNGSPKAFFCSKNGGHLIYRWVSEKTGLNSHDASVVAEIIAAVFDQPVAVVQESWYRRRVPEFAPIYKSRAIKPTEPRI